MQDEPTDIAARINAKRADAAAPRGDVSTGDKPEDDGGGVAARIERLRTNRVFTPKPNAMVDLLAAQTKQFKRESKGTGAVATAWSELCPEHLLERTGVVGVSRGILTLSADDSAARFEVDRVLRCGVERQLLKRLPLNIRRVRVVISADDAQ